MAVTDTRNADHEAYAEWRKEMGLRLSGEDLWCAGYNWGRGAMEYELGKKIATFLEEAAAGLQEHAGEFDPERYGR